MTSPTRRGSEPRMVWPSSTASPDSSRNGAGAADPSDSSSASNSSNSSALATTVPTQVPAFPVHPAQIENAAPAPAPGIDRLWQAALNSNTEEFNRLLKTEGAEINGLLIDGRTLLHHAVAQNQFAAAQWLMKRGANVNTPDVDKCRPLTTAVEQDSVQMVELLTNAGAYAHLDPTAWETAVRCQSSETMKYLQKHCCFRFDEKLIAEIKYGSLETVRTLIENELNNSSSAPIAYKEFLEQAVSSGKLDVIDYLFLQTPSRKFQPTCTPWQPEPGMPRSLRSCTRWIACPWRSQRRVLKTLCASPCGKGMWQRHSS